MKQHYKIALLLWVLPALLLANNPKFKGKFTKTKTINKEYTVNANASLRVDNSYGNIDIVTWNENRTVIEVVITTNGNDEEKVQSKLNKIDIEFSGSGGLVTAKTLFQDRSKSSWSWWGKNDNNIKMEINYTIKMPVSNTVDLDNDYGSISLNKINGTAKISCDYGQVNIGELNGDNNYLSFDYSKNCTIGYMKNGKIDADYSSYVLEKVGDLEISADYTKSEVLNAKNINYNNDYGRLSIGQVTNIIGRGNYIPLKISELKGDLDVNTDYGSITVDEVTASGGDITIRSDYAGIKIGYASGYNFDFVLNLSYASLSGEDNLEILTTDKDYTSKSYTGFHGSKNSGNKININSDYGGVTLRKL